MTRRSLLLPGVLALSIASAWVSPAQAQFRSSGRIVDVRRYGVVGDGVTPDTQAIQRAVDELRPGDTLRFSTGTYLVNSAVGIRLKDDMRLDLGAATILAPSVNGERSRAISIFGKRNIVILGGTLVGSRTGTPRFGVGVLASDAENLIIQGTTVRDFFFDGILLTGNTGCRNVKIRYVIADNNRRSGLTAVLASGVTVEWSTFRGTNGQDPAAGVNIEPNTDGVVDNFRFANNFVTGNAGNGLYIHQGLGVLVSNATVERNTVANNGHGIVAMQVQGITVSNNRVSGHRGRRKAGIHLGNVANGVVSGNIVANNYRGIFTVGGRAEIRANTVFGMGPIAGAGDEANGITCLGYNGVSTGSCVVASNTVRRASSNGIMAQDVNSVRILNNVVEDSGLRGIYLRRSSSNDVSGNAVRRSGYAEPGQNDGIEMAFDANNNVVAQNAIHANTAMRTPIGVGPGCDGNEIRQNTVTRTR